MRRLWQRWRVVVGAAVAPPASPDVWAVVDGREIRRDEVERVYRASLQDAAAVPTPEESLNTKLGIVEELISQDLLTARAAASGLEPTAAEIDAAFAERKRGMSDSDFQKRMNERSLTMDDVKRAIRRELAAQKLFERDVTGKVVVSDQDVTSFFERNRARFNITETQYRLAQIVVTPVRDPQLRNRMNDDAGSPAAAQQKIQMLLTKLRGGGDFAQLAMDYSEDPNTRGARRRPRIRARLGAATVVTRSSAGGGQDAAGQRDGGHGWQCAHARDGRLARRPRSAHARLTDRP